MEIKKLYKLADGKIVKNQTTDKQNRLIYVMEDGSRLLAEKCTIKEVFTVKKRAVINTKINFN